MLSEEDVAMLEFERKWWRDSSAKNQQIRTSFGMDPIRYFQRLNGLIARPEALDFDPVLVNMLLRRRDGGPR